MPFFMHGEPALDIATTDPSYSDERSPQLIENKALAPSS